MNKLAFLVGFWVASMALGVSGTASADECATPAQCVDLGSSGNLARPGITGPAGGLRFVNGIPCTGAHLGACIALRQSP